MKKNRTKLITSTFIWLFLLACQPIEENSLEKTDFTCIASQSHCVINNLLGDFAIKFNRDPIITEVDYQIAVQYSGQQKIKKLLAYIEGKSMYMGKIPLIFTQQENMFIAKSLLGSCSEDNMMWRIWFTAEFEQNVAETANKKAVQKQTFFIDFASQRF